MEAEIASIRDYPLYDFDASTVSGRAGLSPGYFASDCMKRNACKSDW